MRRHLFFAALALAGCSTDFLDARPAVEVQAEIDRLSLAPEEVVVLRAESRDGDGRVLPGDAVRWRSTNEAVVVIDDTGRAVGVAEGDAQLIATAGPVVDTVTVRVRRDWLWIGDQCRVRGDGTASCRGGQLGLAGPVLAAIQFGSGPMTTQCAILATGLQCRGSDWNGARGDGGGASGTNTTAFAPVSGGGNWTEVRGANPHSVCGVRGGVSVCWGSNSFGITAQGTGAGITDAPTPISGGLALTGFHQPEYGKQCGISAGRIWCWGDDIDSVPIAMTAAIDLVQFMAFDGWFCGRTSTGVVRCGPLGDTISTPLDTELRFVDLLGVDPACGLTAAGEIWCWGDNTNGSLGRPGSYSLEPVRIQSPQRFADIVDSERGLCALTVGGAEYCWGVEGANADTPPEAYLPRRTPSPF